MNFLRLKRSKIIISIVAVLLVIAIVLTCVLVNVQFATKNYSLSTMARNILLKTFDQFELGDMAEPKRVIDNENPMNLVNYYGDDDIVNLWGAISDVQKPNTILLLVPGQILPSNSDANLIKLEKWADICEENEIPYCVQAINGETHMEARPPIKYLEDRFAAKHKYFYGLNAAELYNGVSWRGVAESDNTLYIQDMIKLCAKYGAYFIWTDTNLGYKNGMILEWLEQNESFYTTFKTYSQYICLLNKESIADSATYSIMQGLWLAGLVGNWGVASDWWHWQIDGYKSLFDEHNELVDNEWEQIFSYPENMYVQSMMLVMSRGGTCFKQEAPGFAISHDGKLYAGYKYAISPFLDRVISGTLQIPGKNEVFSSTKFAILGRENFVSANYNTKESNLYPQNGAGGIVPLLPKNLRKDERAVFTNRGISLLDYKISNSDFIKAYGENDANTYCTRTAQNWYFINNLENKSGTKYAKFTPQFASAESFFIESSEHSSAIITDSRNGFKVYLSNYRTDKTNMLKGSPEQISELGWANYVSKFLTVDRSGNPLGVTDSTLRKTVIEIKSSLNGGKPKVKWLNNQNGLGVNNRKYNVTETYDEATQTLRLEIEHNGMVEFEVNLVDSGKDYQNTVLPRIEDKYTTIDADISALQELVEEKITDKHNYTYFSYLEYDRHFEKAKVMIEERVYTQKQIDAEVKLLKAAKEGLINISKEVQTLKQIGDGSSYQAATMTAFDSLLREMLSCQKYVNGRSNSLKYKSIYKNKSAVSANKAKVKAIEKAYNNLLLYM